MKTIGIIPARFGSNRLPGKPLLKLHGKSLIQRVYEQASKASLLDEVLVATDDIRILDQVKDFGGKAVLTSEEHPSGTDRIAEAMQKCFPNEDYPEIILNIQGDEPFIEPANLNKLIESMSGFDETGIATLICPIKETADIFNPNLVKVVLDKKGTALYFSRQAIPFIRDMEKEKWLQRQPFYQHLGVYGFRSKTLLELVRLKPSDLEQAESLEQLRWLSNGFSIQTVLVEDKGFGIDTVEDLAKARAILSSNKNPGKLQ